MVRSAIQTLESHHSRSPLPAQARRKLALLPPRSADCLARGAMSQSSPWKCYHCNQFAKSSANYCPGCGSHWSEVAYAPAEEAAPPWVDSPRNQHTQWSQKKDRGRAQSPRGKSKGKGGGKPANKGGKQNGDKSKGKGRGAKQNGPKGGAQAFLSQLPNAPPQGAVPLPKQQGAPPAESSDERKLLDALMHFCATSSTLPEPLQNQLQQYRASSRHTEAKDLHKLVKSRTDAKKELARLEEERASYDAAWFQYVVQLSDLFHKQATERSTYLQQLDEAVEQWTQKSKAASSALTAAAADGSISAEQALAEEELPTGMSVDASRHADAQRERSETLTAAMLSAFQKPKDSASEAAQDRERSRTPGRKRSSDHVISDEDEDKPLRIAPGPNVSPPQ